MMIEASKDDFEGISWKNISGKRKLDDLEDIL
jgi:hypothetical protein